MSKSRWFFQLKLRSYPVTNLETLVDVVKAELTPPEHNLFYNIHGKQHIDLIVQLAKPNKPGQPLLIKQLGKLAEAGIINQLAQHHNRGAVISHLAANPDVAFKLMDEAGKIDEALLEIKKSHLTETKSGRTFPKLSHYIRWNREELVADNPGWARA